MSSSFLLKNETVSPAQIEWRDGLPYSSAFDDIYFSPQDGLAESQYVFIEGCQLAMRWPSHRGHRYQILELGFGSGLNFFATCLAWQEFRRQYPEANLRLHYYSVEKHPLGSSDILRTAAHWPQLAPFAKAYCEQQPDCHYGLFYLPFPEIGVTLHLLQMPIDHALDELLAQQNRANRAGSMDSFFLDGFAPTKNPQMWGEQLSSKLASLANTDATLATFSVAASVRNPLAAAGFKLQKRKGFAHKREMLTATYAQHPVPSSATRNRINPKKDRPWFRLTANPDKKNIAVIGAGIAGVTTAYMLDRQGFRVTLYDQGSKIAAGASGVAAGIFHPQLTSDFNQLSELHWHAYRFNCSPIFRQVWQTGQQIRLAEGVTRRLKDEQAGPMRTMLEVLRISEQWCRVENNRLVFAQAGALDMAQYCQQLLTQCLSVSFRTDTKVKSLHKINEQWSLELKVNEVTESAQFEQVILCCGSETELLPSQLKTDLHLTRGQALIIKSESLARHIQKVICDDVYLVPQGDNRFYLGSTFETDLNRQISEQSSRRLLDSLNKLAASLLPDLSLLDDIEILQTQLGFRLHARDRSPVVGPMPDFAKLTRDFKSWGQRALPDSGDSYNREGLWVNCAYGSHGLLLSLLCADYLASLIADMPSPLPLALQNKLHPARFFIQKIR